MIEGSFVKVFIYFICIHYQNAEHSAPLRWPHGSQSGPHTHLHYSVKNEGLKEIPLML